MRRRGSGPAPGPAAGYRVATIDPGNQGAPDPGRRAAALKGVRLRPCRPEDGDFLYRLYASTRPDIQAILDWDDAEKETFLRRQFEAQRAAYAAARPNARCETIERRGRPIGRLIVDRRDDEIHLVDIALLPGARGRGIGGALIVELCREGARDGRPVRLRVERRNPALGLYRRLGFVEIGDDNVVYALMEWTPRRAAAPELN